jgi:general secretion pathway protein J
MRRRAASSQSAGFTLVEALAATLVMSMIFAGLAMITGQWLPNWDRGAARLQRAALVTLGLDRLTDDLAAAEFISADVEDKAPLFAGAETSVVLVRTALAPNAPTGLEVVRIAQISDASGLAVVRSTAPLPTGRRSDDAEGLLFSNPVVVLRAPYHLAFSYAGPDRVWRDSWQGRRQLPRAVRVLLRDTASATVLAASTSTLIHADLPARCSWPGSVGACPELAGPAGAPGTSDTDMAGAQ